MYIARNPGREEDRVGRPLVGTAGSMAMWILGRCGLRRFDVYLTNVVKCWTPKDRPPYDKEIENCREHLVAEILVVRPKVIVAAGREAAGVFAKYCTDGSARAALYGPISDSRGIPYRCKISGHAFVVVPTFHPSYISRTQYVTKRDAKKKIFNAKPVAIADVQFALSCFEGEAEVNGHIQANDNIRRIAFDLETTGLDPRHDRILGGAFTMDGVTAESTTDTHPLRRMLESTTSKTAQNGPFDIEFAKENGININNYTDDTMMMQHCLAPDLPNNLAFINSLHVHMPPWKTKTKGKMSATETMDPELLAERCRMDAICTWRAREVMEKDLKQAGLYESPYKRLYIPTVPIMVEMQRRGMKFDLGRCERLVAHFYPQYKAIVDRWKEKGVDIGSNKQVGEYLSNCGLALERTTEGKQYRVDDAALQKLNSHNNVRDIQLFRKLQKLLTTDLVGFRNRLDENNIIRTHWNNSLTGTGRFSSTDPDFQNIRLAIRDLFIAREEHYLFGFDYVGMELMVACLLAGDYELAQEIDNGRDVIEEQRRTIYGDRPGSGDSVRRKAERRVAKTYIYGPLYGKTKFSIARDLHVTQADAEHYLSVSCTQRPRFAEWRALQSELAYGSGAVYSAFGRRRLLFADRVDTQAYNSPIQMTAHDIVLETMILVYKELGLVPWVQNHDEIIWELPEEHKHEQIEEDIMSIATRPIKELNNHCFKIDVGRGKNWKEVDVGTEDVK